LLEMAAAAVGDVRLSATTLIGAGATATEAQSEKQWWRRMKMR
jgi:hypothetical protein